MSPRHSGADSMRTRRRPPIAGEEMCGATRARDGAEQREAKGGEEVVADGFQTPRRTPSSRLSRHRRGGTRRAAAQRGSAVREHIMGATTPDDAILEYGLACSQTEHEISWNTRSPSQGPTAERRGAWPMNSNLADIIKKLKPMEEPMPNSMGQLPTLWMETEAGFSSIGYSPEPINYDYTQRKKRRKVECPALCLDELVSMAKNIDRPSNLASRDGNHALSNVRTEHISPPAHGDAAAPRGVTTTAPEAELVPQGSVNSAARRVYTDTLCKRSSPTGSSENGCDEVVGRPTPSPLAIISLCHELAASSEPINENAFPILTQPSQLTFCPRLQSTPIVTSCQREADLRALFDDETVLLSHPLSEGAAVDTGSQDGLAKASAAQSLAEKKADCQNMRGLHCTPKDVAPKHQVVQQAAGVVSNCVVDTLPAKEVGSARSLNLNTGRDGATVASVNIPTENICDDWEDDDWMQNSSFIDFTSQMSDTVKNSKHVDATAKRALVVDQIQDNQRATEGPAHLNLDTVEAASCLTNASIKQSAMASAGSGHFPNRYNMGSREKQNSNGRLQLQIDSSSNCNVNINPNATSNVNSNFKQISHPKPIIPSAVRAVVDEVEWDDFGDMDAILSNIPEPANNLWDKQAGSNRLNNKACALLAATVAPTTASPLASWPAVDAGQAAPARCSVASKVVAGGFKVSSGEGPTTQHSFRFVRTNSAINMQQQALAVAGNKSASELVPLTSVLPGGAQTSVPKPRASAVLPARRHVAPEVAIGIACPAQARSGDSQERSRGAPGLPAAVQASPLCRSRSAFDILSTNSKPVLRRHCTETTLAFTGGPKRCCPDEIERKRQAALDRRRQITSQQNATQLTARPARQLDGSHTNTIGR